MWDCPSLQVYKPLYFSVVLHPIPYPQSIPLVILTSWSSKLQSMVGLSTTQAQYVAGNEAGKEIM